MNKRECDLDHEPMQVEVTAKGLVGVTCPDCDYPFHPRETPPSPEVGKQTCRQKWPEEPERWCGWCVHIGSGLCQGAQEGDVVQRRANRQGHSDTCAVRHFPVFLESNCTCNRVGRVQEPQESEMGTLIEQVKALKQFVDREMRCTAGGCRCVKCHIGSALNELESLLRARIHG